MTRPSENFDHPERFEETSAVPVEAPQNRRGRPKANPLATPSSQEDLFPVKLVRGYRPLGKFKVVAPEDPEDPDSPMVERKPIGETERLDNRKRVKETAKVEYAKCWPGQVIKLPLSEARNVLDAGIGVRADELPMVAGAL